jgi:hypothetical protein
MAAWHYTMCEHKQEPERTLEELARRLLALIWTVKGWGWC